MNSARKSCLYTHFFVHFDQIKIILTLFWSFWWTFVLFVARFVARIGETLDFFEEALWRQKLRTPDNDLPILLFVGDFITDSEL